MIKLLKGIKRKVIAIINRVIKGFILLNINTTGNKKLVNNDKVRFMIWNLPACKTCPYATENCKKFCYARKAEKVYPSVLPSRERNFEETLSADFVGKMIWSIERLLNSKAYKGKLAVFRIHESGDFYNLEYTEKWVRIAKHFENDDRIVFTAYTKSIIYFINCGYGLSNFPKNLIIRSSIWNDTRKDLVELTECYNFSIYTALSAEDMEKEKAAGHNFFKCECKDCGTCLECYRNKEKDIIVEIH
jgi:hypothetical protein